MQILLPLFTQGSSQECQSSIHLVICDWFRYDTRPKQKSPCVVLSCSGVNREILPLLLCSWNWKDRRVSSGLVQAHSHGCSRFSRQWVVHKVLSRPRLGTGTSVLLLHPVGQSTSPALTQRMRNSSLFLMEELEAKGKTGKNGSTTNLLKQLCAYTSEVQKFPQGPMAGKQQGQEMSVSLLTKNLTVVTFLSSLADWSMQSRCHN